MKNQTSFTKGHQTNLGKHWKLSDATKAKHSIAKSGSKNPKWKGENTSYSGFHKWVVRNFGNPQKCEKCKTTEKRMYHWAVKNRSKGGRNRKDWLRLCVPCHIKYDKMKKSK